MNQDLLKEITKDQIKSDVANFKVGEGVPVPAKVREGAKEGSPVQLGDMEFDFIE